MNFLWETLFSGAMLVSGMVCPAGQSGKDMKSTAQSIFSTETCIVVPIDLKMYVQCAIYDTSCHFMHEHTLYTMHQNKHMNCDILR